MANAGGYLAARLFIGFSLASFVACQFWCSVLFNPRCGGWVAVWLEGGGQRQRRLPAAAVPCRLLLPGRPGAHSCVFAQPTTAGRPLALAGLWALPTLLQLDGATRLAALRSSSCRCCCRWVGKQGGNGQHGSTQCVLPPSAAAPRF